MAGKFAAGIFDELLKGEARVRKPPLKRAYTQAQFVVRPTSIQAGKCTRTERQKSQ